MGGRLLRDRLGVGQQVVSNWANPPAAESAAAMQTESSNHKQQPQEPPQAPCLVPPADQHLLTVIPKPHTPQTASVLARSCHVASCKITDTSESAAAVGTTLVAGASSEADLIIEV